MAVELCSRPCPHQFTCETDYASCQAPACTARIAVIQALPTEQSTLLPVMSPASSEVVTTTYQTVNVTRAHDCKRGRGRGGAWARQWSHTAAQRHAKSGRPATRARLPLCRPIGQRSGRNSTDRQPRRSLKAPHSSTARYGLTTGWRRFASPNFSLHPDASLGVGALHLMPHCSVPEVPVEPKLVPHPFDTEQVFEYNLRRPPGLESTYAFPLHAELDVGVPIDIMDPSYYDNKAPRGELHDLDREITNPKLGLSTSKRNLGAQPACACCAVRVSLAAARSIHVPCVSAQKWR